MGLYSWFGERPHDTAAHWSSMGKRSVLLAMADAARDEQREYEALVLQFAAAMAGDDSAEHVINLAVELADQYLEWRKMEREEFKRCKS